MVRLKLMKKRITLVTFFFLIMPACTATYAGEPPKTGGQLPDIHIAVLSERGYNGYLGLSPGEKSFRIPEIRARVVILEILSMYCPFCQKEAPSVNKLYEAIEQDPKLKGKIKIIGIGAGNTTFEVELFKKKYGILFPIYPDPDFSMHKQFGEVGTPYFIAVKIDDNGSHEVIYSKPGKFGKVAPFLGTLCKKSALQ
jgi:thiol-disulfide isomerase/thioredoxin